MITLLPLDKKNIWFPLLKEKLKQNIDLLDMSVELIENRLLRNELHCFDINSELIALGNIYTYGNERVFFLYFLVGKNLQKNVEEMFNYAKLSLGCEKLDFHFKGEARDRLYKKVFHNYNRQYRTYCNITL